MASRPWQLYIVQTAAGWLYTGISHDAARRLVQHQQGKGARALRGKGPLQLVLCCDVADHQHALRLEHRIKRLRRKDKLQLIAEQPALIDVWLRHNHFL